MKKNSPLTILSFLLFFAGFFLTCRKIDKANVNSNSNISDLTIKVNASVSGFVTNEFDNPMPGAKIVFGSLTTTSDKYGHFEIRNTDVVQNAAILTITSPGYFKGIKTLLTSSNNSSFIRVKLIPKSRSGTISASGGGTVALASGMKVALPPNSIVNAVTKQAYTGTVDISSFYIDPTAEDLGEIMPGNLSGLDNSNELKILTTYGMVAVEMTGNSGESLQISEGKTATLTLPIPSAILGNAPSSIPLWYFDENSGLWKEQGTAVKAGNTYVGEVSHFSFWNCDIKGTAVPFNCSVYADDRPLKNVEVRITEVNNSSNSRHDFTNDSGYVEGLIPADKELTLEVVSGCGIVYSKTFTSNSYLTNTGSKTRPVCASFGKINIASLYNVKVSGNVVNCSNQSVTNGIGFLQSGTKGFSFMVDDSGRFSFNTLICPNSDFSIIAEDRDTKQQSAPKTYKPVNGSVSTGNIVACGTSTEEYSNLDVDGQKYMLGPYPNGTFMSGGGLYGDQTQFSPTLVKLKNGVYVKNSDHIQWGMSYRRNPYNLLDSNYVTYFAFYAGADEGYRVIFYHYADHNPPIKVNLTEYGPVGGFISGTVDGTLYNGSGLINTDTTYRIAYQFRFRRLN